MIVATILSGNSERIVADAVRSVVEQVDLVLLIDTGVTDRTARIVEELAGEKFRRESFPWRNDFAAARNFSLAAAAKHGGEWAVTVDTDERLQLPAYPDRAALAAALDARPEILVYLVASAEGDYLKERFIRTPSRLVWRGSTHEAFEGAAADERATLAGCTFTEEAKSAPELAHKLRRDRELLTTQTHVDPTNGRAWFYLGRTLEALELPQEAVPAYRRAAELESWDEQAAWACYLAASCLSRLERYREAIEFCGLGLARHSGLAELPWLAAFCCHRLGELRKAEYWAEMSILLGNYEGISAGAARVGFRHLPAWYESPFDVLRFVLRELGDNAGAESAERNYQAALAMRETC